MTELERQDRRVLDGNPDALRRRRYPPCQCPDPGRGDCWCADDGDVTHGGAEIERRDWQSGNKGAIRV